MHKDDAYWRKVLTDEQYKVLRQKGTEWPFSGDLLWNEAAGVYVCAACGSQLFESGTKFDTYCGWPSFYDVLPGSVKLTNDTSHGMRRIEVQCARCEGHLGHVFDDAPDQPTGLRYCVSSVSLGFVPKSDGKKTRKTK